MTQLIALPILVPLAASALSLVVWRHPRLQSIVCLAGSVVLLASAIGLLRAVRGGSILVSQLGGWPAPFGITLVADITGAAMVTVTAVIGLAVSVYSLASVDAPRRAFGYFPLVSTLVAGVCGAFLTGDLFNLYVWFEVLLISSFVLLSLGGERKQIVGAVKYVTLNLVASALFLAGVGILYGLTGTLNMADLSVRLAEAEQQGIVTTAALLLATAFGIKAAVFPLFFWLPDSYHTPPAAVTALFAGLLTKVGVYSLIRLFTLVFARDAGFVQELLLVVAALTMVTGVLGAAAQEEIRKILSFHIVSQIGYMLMGLALFTPVALAAALFFVIHNILVKTNLLLIAGIVQRLEGSYELARLGGIWRASPMLGLLFLVPALSLAGVPPLSGFFAKLWLVQAGLEEERYVLVAVSLLVSLLTLYSMTKIWNQAFWKPSSTVLHGARQRVAPATALALAGPSVVLAMMTVVIGLAPAPLLSLAADAGSQLARPQGYIDAVLGAP